MCKGSLEISELSKAFLVDGFKFPSAIALTIVEGSSGPKTLRFSLSDSRKFSGRGFRCLSSSVLISYIRAC